MRERARRLTLDVLAATLLDVDLGGDRGQVVRAATEAVGDLSGPTAAVLPSWLPTPARRRYRRAMADLDDAPPHEAVADPYADARVTTEEALEGLAEARAADGPEELGE